MDVGLIGFPEIIAIILQSNNVTTLATLNTNPHHSDSPHNVCVKFCFDALQGFAVDVQGGMYILITYMSAPVVLIHVAHQHGSLYTG